MDSLEIKLELILNKDKPRLKAFTNAYSNLIDLKKYRSFPSICLDFGKGLTSIGLKTVDLDSNRMTIVYNAAVKPAKTPEDEVVWNPRSYISGVSKLLDAIESKNKTMFNGSYVRITWIPNNLPLNITFDGIKFISIKPITKAGGLVSFRKNEKESIKDSLKRIILDSISKIDIDKRKR